MPAKVVSTVRTPAALVRPKPVRSVKVSELMLKPASKVARPPKAAVEEALTAPAMFALLVKVEDALEIKPLVRVERPVKTEVPSTASVELAPRAPPTLRLLAKVDDALEMRPPEESILKSVLAVLSTKRRKSPANTAVDEAKMRE